jgi:hypothetical protein
MRVRHHHVRRAVVSCGFVDSVNKNMAPNSWTSRIPINGKKPKQTGEMECCERSPIDWTLLV